MFNFMMFMLTTIGAGVVLIGFLILILATLQCAGYLPPELVLGVR